ncbi:carbamoyltransferase [Succinimonas sp.]|uniref:carbamoyltransferase family protein n=1 Tax=Succinimonas sp. TaxID=1936151 RepID=UPI00386623CF
MKKYILGLNIGHHDTAAALIRDGELVMFVEQERISRHKMALGESPAEAIQECLNREGITMADVTAVSVGMDWKYRNQIYEMSETEKAKYTMYEDPDWFLPREIFGSCRPPVYSIRHHLSHAASACRLSGFRECAVLVTDNRGEDAAASLGVYRNGEISFFRQIGIQHSPGIFYNRAARYAGLYGKYREVGKFMGLSSYGRPVMKMPLSPSRDGRLFSGLENIDNEGIFASIGLRTEQLAAYFEENCFPYQAGNAEEVMSYANFAASAQHALESVILDFAAELREVTGMDSLAMAGGVALNCAANGKLADAGLFSHIFVPPFASDAGTAAGSAMELYYRLFGKSRADRPLKLAGLGCSYTDEETLQALGKYEDQVSFARHDPAALCRIVAKALSEGLIAGWVQGGFEAGPRALGNRSILADPRSRRSLIRLNQIKDREMWRPIAPSILEEDYSSYFEGDPEFRRFMNVAALVREDRRRVIPAAVHVDNTARPQTVSPDQPLYYGLLRAFREITGVPVLCNTSFNQRGEPLVNTPEDALNCFLSRGIDLLVIGSFVIQRKETA